MSESPSSRSPGSPETAPPVRSSPRPGQTNRRRLSCGARIGCCACPTACPYLGRSNESAGMKKGRILRKPSFLRWLGKVGSQKPPISPQPSEFTGPSCGWPWKTKSEAPEASAGPDRGIMDGKCMDGLRYTAFLSRAGAFVYIEKEREREIRLDWIGLD